MNLVAKKRSLDKARHLSRLPAKPQLTLRPDADEVKAKQSISVEVSFKGCERVELTLEPRGLFTLDQKVLEAGGTVTLLGKKDGIATLIGTGVRRNKDVVQRMIHLRCHGPLLRIKAFGYTPRGKRG